MKYNSALLTVSILLVISVSHAQSISESLSQMKWQFEGGVLKFPNNEAVISAKVSKNAYGLVRIDNNAVEKWKYDLKENDGHQSIVGIGKVKGNILVLTANTAADYPYYTMIKRIDAILIDGEKGTLIREKTVLTFPGTTFIKPLLLTNKDGEVQQLLLRHSRWDGKSSGTTMDQAIAGTKKIELYNFADDLTPTQTQEYGINADVYLYSVVNGPAGELLMLWLNKKAELVLERFKDEGVESRMIIPFEWDKKTNFTVAMRLNPNNPSQVLCGITYHFKDRMVSTILVDMDQKTSKSFIETVNGATREKFEDESATFNSKKINLLKLAFDNFTLTQIDYYQDKIVILRELAVTDAVITVLDKDLNVMKHFLFHKSQRMVWGARTVDMRVDGDMLRLVTSDNVQGNTGLYYGEIDLKKLQWSKFTKLKQGKEDSFNPSFRIYNTIWFPGNVLVHQPNPPAMNPDKFRKELRPVTFND